MDVLKRIGNAAVVPVVVLDRAEDAVPAARALLAGGIDVMEITFRTAAGRDAIAAVARECPEMLVGAGTVLNVAQGREAVEAGAKFIVSPGFSRELIDECAAQGIPALPGCATPSEIMDALDAGLKIVKFFPANVYGGLDAMKALASAFVGVKFMPTGGINAKNLAEYLSAPFIHAVGGTWLCSRTDIAAHNFDRITALCGRRGRSRWDTSLRTSASIPTAGRRRWRSAGNGKKCSDLRRRRAIPPASPERRSR